MYQNNVFLLTYRQQQLHQELRHHLKQQLCCAQGNLCQTMHAWLLSAIQLMRTASEGIELGCQLQAERKTHMQAAAGRCAHA